MTIPAPVAKHTRSLPRGLPARLTWAHAMLGLWGLVVAASLYIVVVGTPLRFLELQRTNPVNAWSLGVPDYVDSQLHPLEAEVLARAGLSLADYSAYIVILELLHTALFAVASVLIVWQRRDDWLAVMIAAALLCIGLTQPAIDTALAAIQPLWHIAIDVMQGFGLFVAFAFIFLVFPDGRFTPPWTRYGFLGAVALMIGWIVYPELPYNPVHGATWEKTPIQSTLMNSALFGAGLYAQYQRYRDYATPLERQQIKAAAFGVVALFVAECARGISFASLAPPEGPGALALLVNALRYPVFTFLILFLPVGFGIAILRYRLWNFDEVLRRTALYALLTAGCVALYVLIVVLSSVLVEQWTDLSRTWFTAASALMATLLLLPLYRIAQRRIDRAFNRQWLDYQEELGRFSRTVRTRLTLDDITAHLLARVESRLACDWVALATRHNTAEPDAHRWDVKLQGDTHVDAAQIAAQLDAPSSRDAERWARGETVRDPDDVPAELVVPLLVQRAETSELVALLLCGPRKTGQPYDRPIEALLAGMADQAAAAMLVAELVETERRLEQHRSTPLGQAELLAAHCHEPSAARRAILDLFQHAVGDSAAAQQLAHLPAVLRSQGGHQPALLAEGCHLLVNGRKETGDLIVGLQRIQRYLQETGGDLPESVGNQALVSFLLQGLQCTELKDLRATLGAAHELTDKHSAHFDEIVRWMRGLEPLQSALDRYARSLNVDDRLVYLVDALSRTAEVHVQSSASTSVAGLVIVPMIARWNQILVDAVRDERSRVVVTLLPVTQTVTAERPAYLTLEARNAGWHKVDRVAVSLVSCAEVKGTLAAIELHQLEPGEIAPLHFPVRVGQTGPFHAVFDVQVFAGETRHATYSIELTFEATGSELSFRQIPNPYVTGSPLRADSPLFVGRRAELDRAQAALNHPHTPGPVLLTGPKRMGKTSLLYRLPRVLDDTFVPVYVDMQGIGYAPGLGNFLLDLAHEIARALGLASPALDEPTADHPGFFTDQFLPQVDAALGTRRLVILLDEYEEFYQRVASRVFGPEVFTYLRHLTQSQPQIGWVFAGTHRLVDLPVTDGLSLFSGAVHLNVGRLDAEHARRLIAEPVEGFLEYDDLALDKMYRLTAGHPYFLQLLCHAAVVDANRAQRTHVALEDVEIAAAKTLEMGEAHLVALWRELSPVEQAVAEAVAHLGDRNERVELGSIAGRIPAAFRADLQPTLDDLARRQVLATENRGEGVRFALELQRRWVALYARH